MEDICLLRGGGLNTSTSLNLFTREGTHLKGVESNKPRYTIRFEGHGSKKKKSGRFLKRKREIGSYDHEKRLDSVLDILANRPIHSVMYTY